MVAPAGGPVVVHRRQKLDLPESNLQACRVFDTEATLLGQDLLHKAIILDFKFVKRSKTTNLHDRRWFSLHKTRPTGKHSLHDEETFILAHEEKKLK